MRKSIFFAYTFALHLIMRAKQYKSISLDVHLKMSGLLLRSIWTLPFDFALPHISALNHHVDMCLLRYQQTETEFRRTRYIKKNHFPSGCTSSVCVLSHDYLQGPHYINMITLSPVYTGTSHCFAYQQKCKHIKTTPIYSRDRRNIFLKSKAFSNSYVSRINRGGLQTLVWNDISKIFILLTNAFLSFLSFQHITDKSKLTQ